MRDNRLLGSHFSPLHVPSYAIAPWLVAFGFLLLLGGFGASYAGNVRVFNGRGDIVSGLVAGVGVVFILVGIVLGQVV